MADSLLTGSVAVTAAAVLADISGILHTYPVISFVGMGMVGGLAGWALAMDRGDLDGKDFRYVLCMLARRILLGGCIGLASAVWWSDDRQSQGLWVMLTGFISIDPVRGVKAIWDKVLERAGKGAQ